MVWSKAEKEQTGVPSMAMQRTTFSPRCCYVLSSDNKVQSKLLVLGGIIYRDLKNELAPVVVDLERV